MENNYTFKKINREDILNKDKSLWRIFFRKREMLNVLLSPDGKYLAYLKPFQKRMNIHVRRLDGSEPEKRITNQTTRDIFHIQWKGNHTILFERDFGGDENFHVFRVSVTGKDEKDLTPFKDTQVRIVDMLENTSEDHILISTNQRDKRIFDVYRLNVKTGESIQVAENPGNYIRWMADHKGKLRVALSSEGLEQSVYYRDTEQDDFQKIMTINLIDDDFSPLLFTFDNKNLYVLSNLNKDKTAIEIFDPREKKILSTLFSHPEVDVVNLDYSKERKVLNRALFVTWKKQFHFFDSQMEQIFKNVQSKFPEKEIDLISMNKKEDLAVFFVCSDRNPGTYYLYDTKSMKLEKIADSCPWLKEEDLAEDKPIQYTSRDGLVIHGYLTLPKGSSGKNLPVIINPHGGPWARDIWGYNPEKQFLANRGYAVLQMNFRGSKGYGKKFLQASFKQWGRKMQNDITDGVEYLVDKGIADRNRIGIYGGSYGGYAVLAGLAFTPDLYACGVDYVGISNLFTHLKSTPPYWKLLLEKLYDIIGHPEKDEQLLKEISPLFHADKIKAPLFVVHGANDPRVKKSESDQIVLSLKKRGIKTLYMVKDNEGHGFRNEENKIEFYTLLESFLENSLLKEETNP